MAIFPVWPSLPALAGLFCYNQDRSSWKSSLLAKVQKKMYSWFDFGKKRLYQPVARVIESIAIGAGIVVLCNLVGLEIEL